MTATYIELVSGKKGKGRLRRKNIPYQTALGNSLEIKKHLHVLRCKCLIF